MGIREYLRCPCCGKLSTPDNFLIVGKHDLEVRVQTLAGKADIKWATRDLSREEEALFLMFLAGVVDEAREQITQRVKELDPEWSLDTLYIDHSAIEHGEFKG